MLNHHRDSLLHGSGDWTLERRVLSAIPLIRSPQDDDATPSRDFALLGESVVLLSAQSVTEWRLRP